MKPLIIIIVVFFAGLLGYNYWISTKSGLSMDTLNNPVAARQNSLDSLKLLQAVKAGNPQMYEHIQQMANQHLSGAEMSHNFKVLLHLELDPVIRLQASDAARYLWAKTYFLQMQNAKRKGNCSAIAFPKDSDLTPAQVRNLLSAETQSKTVAAFKFALTDTSKSTQASRDIKEFWYPIMRKMNTRFGDDVSLLDDKDVVDKKRRCAVKIGLFEEMLSQPEDLRAQTLAYYFKSNPSVVLF